MTPRTMTSRLTTSSIALATILSLAAAPAFAQDRSATPDTTPPTAPAEVPADQLDALFDALDLSGMIEVMAQEGTDYGDALAESMFPAGSVPSAWTETVAAIYDPARMEERVRADLASYLAGEDVAPMTAFFAAEPGRSFVRLELAGRQAMLDEDVEEAAKEAAAVAVAGDDPRLDLIRRYAEASDLIETNVVSAMNTNVAYLTGLMDGGAANPDLTESDVLEDVASQEPRIRADTIEWLYAFLLMSYQPASDADIETLIAFTETEPGQALNRALFRTFDDLFDDISHSLGLASARYMTTQEL